MLRQIREISKKKGSSARGESRSEGNAARQSVKKAHASSSRSQFTRNSREQGKQCAATSTAQPQAMTSVVPADLYRDCMYHDAKAVWLQIAGPGAAIITKNQVVRGLYCIGHIAPPDIEAMIKDGTTFNVFRDILLKVALADIAVMRSALCQGKEASQPLASVGCEAVADGLAAASAALAEHLIGAKREVSQVSDQSPVAKRVLEQIWPKLDPEAQGVVPTKELFQLLVKVCAPLPEDKVKRLVEDADADHDGRVSREELLTLLVVLSDAKTGWSTRRVSAAQSDRPSRHIRLSRGRDNWSIEH